MKMEPLIVYRNWRVLKDPAKDSISSMIGESRGLRRYLSSYVNRPGDYIYKPEFVDGNMEVRVLEYRKRNA